MVVRDTWTNGKLYSQRQMTVSYFIGYMFLSDLCWVSWRFTGMCLVLQEPEAGPIKLEITGALVLSLLGTSCKMKCHVRIGSFAVQGVNVI